MKNLEVSSGISLIRLVYSSRLCSWASGDVVGDIVHVSNMRNKAIDITGMLAMDGDRICQILEGPAEAVAYLYSRIERDRRHEGVVELSRSPIEKRAFPNWGMRRLPMAEAAIVAFSR